MLFLTNETWQVTINPNHGACIMAGFVNHGGQWLPVMPDTRGGQSDLDCASFIMIPYSNRIEAGRFTFEEQAYQLAFGDRNSIHGDTRQRVWTVAEARDDYIRCTIDSRDYADFNWPWAITAEAVYQLQGEVFSSELRITNQSETSMPVGMGWHPYFNRVLTDTGETVHLQFQVDGTYPDANNNRIPSGPPIPVPAAADFTTAQTLNPDNFLDGCFYGYDGNGQIHWPQSGVKLTFDCSDECSHLVVYNPGGKPYFAVEPVTNANNGVNLYAQGEATSGVASLAPGDDFTARFDIKAELS